MQHDSEGYPFTLEHLFIQQRMKVRVSQRNLRIFIYSDFKIRNENDGINERAFVDTENELTLETSPELTCLTTGVCT